MGGMGLGEMGGMGPGRDGRDGTGRDGTGRDRKEGRRGRRGKADIHYIHTTAKLCLYQELCVAMGGLRGGNSR